MIEVWQRVKIDDAYVIEPWRVHSAAPFAAPYPEPWKIRGIVNPITPVEPWQRYRQAVASTEDWQVRASTFI